MARLEWLLCSSASVQASLRVAARGKRMQGSLLAGNAPQRKRPKKERHSHNLAWAPAPFLQEQNQGCRTAGPSSFLFTPASPCVREIGRT